MRESIEQLKRLHALEDVENAIFALERGIPAHPRVTVTIKMLFDAMVAEYNATYAVQQEQPEPEPEQSSPGTD